MPDRYGERDDDHDTLQRVPDLEDLAEIARQRRSHLTSGRPPRNTRDAREEVRRQRIAAQLAATEIRAAGIPDCDLCDDDGYTPTGSVCDHTDRSVTYARGRYLIQAAMGWDTPPDPPTPPVEDACSPATGSSGQCEPSSTLTPCRDAPGRSQTGGS